MLISQIALCQQPTDCKVVKKYENGCYLVQIGDNTYFAMTEKVERKILKTEKDLVAAEKKIALKDSLITNYNETIVRYDSTLKKLKKYNVELEDILKNYKELLKDYKKLKEPYLTFNGGIGVTGKNYKPVVLMGIGFSEFNVWGVFQERNSGLMIGKQFRLY